MEKALDQLGNAAQIAEEEWEEFADKFVSGYMDIEEFLAFLRENEN